MESGLSVGSPVFTLDGKQLGVIKQLGDNQFKVDAPMRTDFWLSYDCIRQPAEADRITVDFTHERLGEFITEPRPSMTGNR
jgi:hypothetical protein